MPRKDFSRRKSVEAAEIALLDRRLVTIPAADWKKFEAWANSPPADIPELRELAASKPVGRTDAIPAVMIVRIADLRQNGFNSD
jgi:uncharacterized protein (DUF1778 family)